MQHQLQRDNAELLTGVSGDITACCHKRFNGQLEHIRFYIFFIPISILEDRGVFCPGLYIYIIRTYLDILNVHASYLVTAHIDPILIVLHLNVQKLEKQFSPSQWSPILGPDEIIRSFVDKVSHDQSVAKQRLGCSSLPILPAGKYIGCQMLTASIVIGSESGAPITTPSLIVVGCRP